MGITLSLAVEPFNTLDLARFASWSLTRRFARAFYGLIDHYRQIRALPGDENLRRAVFSPERPPAEGARSEIGDRIHAYFLDGRRRRFKICGVLSGGFSNVYIVIDLDEMKAYCLKENRATPGEENQKNAALEIEAKIILAIGEHANLPMAYSVFYINDRLFVLTEYVSGSSLDFQLKNRPLDLMTALKYAVHICRAVHYAQTVLPGFVHGDIKPGNCLITLDGTLKLTDFGQASAPGLGKHPADGSLSEKPAKNSGWGGTRSYMAPEMFDSQSPTREASDMYAFGITLFEMIGGRRPFSASSKSDLINLHRHGEIPLSVLSDRSVPKRLLDLISQCLAKTPCARPASFSDVADELCDISIKELGVALGAPTTPARTSTAVDHALSHAVLGDYDKAIECLDGASDEAGRYQIAAYKALILHAANKHKAALDLSTKASQFEPPSFVTLYAHATMLYSVQRDQDAETYIDRALRLCPRNPLALDLKGKILARNGRPRQAIRSFESSIYFDNGRIEPYIELARIHLAADQPAQAIRVAEKGAGIYPQNARLLGTLGEAYFYEGRLVESIDCLKNSLCLAPYSSEKGKLLIRSCIALQRSLGHVADTRLSRILLQAARLSNFDGGANAASKRFTTDLIRLSESSEAAALLFYYTDGAIISLSDTMDPADCETLVDRLCTTLESHSVNPMPDYIFCSIGRLFYEFHAYEQCAEAFSTMLAVLGPDERAHYYLGVCSELQDDLESSLEHFKKAIRLNKNHELTRSAVRRVSARLAADKSAFKKLDREAGAH